MCTSLVFLTASPIISALLLAGPPTRLREKERSDDNQPFMSYLVKIKNVVFFFFVFSIQTVAR